MDQKEYEKRLIWNYAQVLVAEYESSLSKSMANLYENYGPECVPTYAFAAALYLTTDGYLRRMLEKMGITEDDLLQFRTNHEMSLIKQAEEKKGLN